MTEQQWYLLALGIYLIGMLLIGWYGYRRSTSDMDGYMLGGRGLHPAIAALSAGASDMSGWLLMGLPGGIFLTVIASGSGMQGAWMAIGLTVGAWLNWKLTAPRLRSYTEVARNSITIPSFLENRVRDTSRILRVTAGVVILVFFTFYVSSGLVAGGKFFQSTFFDQSAEYSHYLIGLAIVGGVVVIYTFVGGFLAVSLTDMAQGLMMFTALIAVPVVTIATIGGVGEMVDITTSANPQALSLFSGISWAAAISAAAWGLGYFGQPHIIVRFMALRSPSDAPTGRRIGIGWMIVAVVGAVMTAVSGAAYFSSTHYELADAETVFLVLSRILFHPLIAGLVLSAVLAAIMSTISSQLLVVSSALVEDLYKGLVNKTASTKTLVLMSRIAVVLVAVVAALLSLDPDSTILGLVAFAWAGFGAAFGPVIIAALYWKRLTSAGAIAGMIVGAVTVGIWGNVPAHTGFIYEIVPGFILGGLALIIVSLITPAPSQEVIEEFDLAAQLSTDKDAYETYSSERRAALQASREQRNRV